MITYLKGTILSLFSEPPSVVILVGGVGYEVLLPVFVNNELASSNLAVDDEIELDIYYHATERQPKPMLVGFLDKAQKEFFEQVIDVEGIGPVKAVSALVMPPQEIATAIESKDVNMLTQLPGVGRRAAEKMIASLHGKLKFTPAQSSQFGATSSTTSAQNEAVQGLVILKLGISEARKLVEDVVRANPSIADNTEEIIREVFKAQQNQLRGTN